MRSERDGAFGGDIPGHYDRGLGPVIFAGYAADMARRTASVGRPSRILETAAGSGIVTRALRDVLADEAHITVTDLDTDMLDVARAKFRADENVTFQQADAMALPFADCAFDTVICQFGVMFYPDKDQCYRESCRVLAPGGRYLFSVWDAQSYNAYGRIVQEVTRSFFPADPPRFFEVPFGYHLIDPIKGSLLAAGFDEIEISVVPRHQRVEDFSAFAGGLVFGTPAFDQIRRRGGIAALEIQAAVATAMRRAFGHEPGVVRMQAIVFQARRTGPDSQF